MTRIWCQWDACVFWREGLCSSEEIELDPELGCLTLMEEGDLGEEDEDWDDEDLFDEDGWDEDL